MKQACEQEGGQAVVKFPIFGFGQIFVRLSPLVSNVERSRGCLRVVLVNLLLKLHCVYTMLVLQHVRGYLQVVLVNPFLKRV